MVFLDIESGVTKYQTAWHISKVLKRAHKHIVQLTTM